MVNVNISVFSISMSKDSIMEEETMELEEPRYLRMEANPFHKSEMSLGSGAVMSYSNISTTSTDRLHEQSSSSLLEKDPARILELSASTIVENGGDKVKKRSREKTRAKESCILSGRGTPTHDEMKKVVERLTDSYDVAKLKILTQVSNTLLVFIAWQSAVVLLLSL